MHAKGCAGLEGEDVVKFPCHDEKITSTNLYELIQMFVKGYIKCEALRNRSVWGFRCREGFAS